MRTSTFPLTRFLAGTRSQFSGTVLLIYGKGNDPFFRDEMPLKALLG
jgi:hypothetical protein